MLAAGPELIDDIRKAPDDVLSGTVPANEVCSVRMQHRALILTKDCLVPSAGIHARVTERARRIHHALGPFQINAEYCSHFQGCPRGARHGHERLRPDTRG